MSLNPAQAGESLPVPLQTVNQVFDSIAISRDGQQVGWITNVDRSTLYTVTIWDRTATTGSLVQYRGDHGAGMWLDRLVFEGIEPLGIYVDNTHIEVRQLRDGVIRYQIATSDSLDTISQDETYQSRVIIDPGSPSRN